MKSSRLALVSLIAVASLALAGCAPAEPDLTPGNGGTKAGSDTSLADIVADGKIVVGTEGTYRPFTFHEGGAGKLTGYDVEIIEAVAKKLDVKVEYAETQWDAIFAGLDAGRFDLIANQVSITDEREAKYDLSEPYTVSTGVLIVAADNTDISSLADLKGKTTAQSLSSNWYTLASDNGATVEQVEGWAQSVALLEQGRIDATLNDKLTYLDYITEKPAAADKIKVVAETDDPSRNAFVVAKGSTTLIDAINKALDELRADGTLAKISEKYFGADVSQ
ncbi:MAG: amino acid ABC transporter substrate-binding protein [Microbacteriaceae bacterium]